MYNFMSMNCDDYRDPLEQVFDIYKDVGVFDDAVIIENTAFFAVRWYFRKNKLLRGEPRTAVELERMVITEDLVQSLFGTQFSSTKTLVPSEPTQLTPYQFDEVATLVESILDQVSDPGQWFDTCLIPRFPAMTRGGRYPTPRHITHFMARLINVSSKDELADLACGTGGMLVAGGRVERAIGVEISPNLERIAFTNLVLHEQGMRDLYLGNLFFVISKSISKEPEYDAVLMNPPFGMTIEPSLLAETFGGVYTGRSETLFTSLAYAKLKSGGRMAIMVPSGVLFSNSTGERILRDMLLEDNALKAVISLPKDATQPYSALPTHILVARKPKDEPAVFDDIWFYRARYDGFTPGRNRQPDPEHNDLPAIQSSVSDWLETPSKTEDLTVLTKPLLNDHILVAYRIHSPSDIPFKVSNLFSSFDVAFNYLVEIGQPVSELRLLETDTVHSIKPDLVTAKIKFPSRVASTFRDEYYFAEGEFDGATLKYTGNLWQIHKGKAVLANLLPAEQDSESPKAFLVDPDGAPISPVFALAKPLKELKPPLALNFYNAITSRLSGQMIIFPPEGLLGRRFTTDKTAYLFENTAESIVILYRNGIFDVCGYSRIYESDDASRGCLLNHAGDILAVAIPAETVLNLKSRELDPVRYIPEKRPTEELRSPSQVLAEIKKNQNALNDHIGKLMGIAELGSVATATLPPPIQATIPPTNLRGIQRSIWQAIEKTTEQVYGVITPKPFQADDIAKLVGEISATDVQRTLELFERMGLIVMITLDGVAYYRLLIERDLESIS